MDRAACERIIFDAAGPKLALVGIDEATGPVAALGQPIALATLEAGGSVAAFPAATDADLASIPAASVARFHDILILRVLELVLSRWAEADQAAGSENRMDLGKLYQQIQADVAARRESLASRYGDGLAPIVRGRLVAGRSRRRVPEC